ncbi:MAG: hypothetical protein WCK35_07475 [Chloroflexota bacterium]
MSFKVRNDGVAPVYVNKNQTYLRLALLDSTEKVLVFSDPLSKVNPFTWKPGVTINQTVRFSFPLTPNVAYLAIGLFSTASNTDPEIKLGNSGVLPNNWFPIQGALQP